MNTKFYTVLLAIALPVLSLQASPYLDNPLMENLLGQRYQVVLATVIDTASNDHEAFSLLTGMGIFITENWAAGVYGSLRRTDRKLPKKMDFIYGLGVYSEYILAPQSVIQPFGGVRLGFIDTSGPSYPTSLTAAGLLGVKIPVSERLAFSSALVLNWAQEELLDWSDDEDNFPGSGSNTDLSVEIGVRYRF